MRETGDLPDFVNYEDCSTYHGKVVEYPLCRMMKLWLQPTSVSLRTQRVSCGTASKSMLYRIAFVENDTDPF